ncbi:PRC-barrel domain-containing protein [Candidatus Micrarchaeota archaeon]|jgi:sporulation protein YlmC with PRC-barrel domain|nr:PRC-barrel domain-containing protein [Candidatus Micrarchaeota archaeon]
MAKLIIAKQLAGKRVVSGDGEELGKLIDLTVEETTGKLSELMIEPNPDSITVRQLKREDGLVMVPYASVLAVSDFIIIDKRAMSSNSTSSILEGYGR